MIKQSYRPRIADKILQQKLKAKGAVLIEGTKWCGKTTTASQIAQSILYLQDPAQKKQNLVMAATDPSFLLEGETPRLIDEWQLAPTLWDAIRFEVDQRNEFGQFILTGSAVPADLSEISHTGIGRISRFVMRPMSLFESGESTGSVSLKMLFDPTSTIKGKRSINMHQLAFLICRGGWPGSLDREEDIALQQAKDYYDTLVNSDISRIDNVTRQVDRAKKILRAYARAIGTQSRIPSLQKDIETNDFHNISDVTLRSYISILKLLFVLEDCSAWNPNLRSQTAIRTSNTRYFTDPSIGTAALGLGPQDLIQDLHTMGLFFENLCIRDLRIYTDYLGGNVYHYRDKSGLECDAVIHLPNGQYGLIEIKLGGDRAIEEAILSLKKLTSQIEQSSMPPPAFKMVLTGLTPYAYKRPDGITIVPIVCLKP